MPSIETKNDEHENIETEANKSDSSPSRKVLIPVLFFTCLHICVLIFKACLLIVMPNPVNNWSSYNGSDNHGSVKETKCLGPSIFKAQSFYSKHKYWVNYTYS